MTRGLQPRKGKAWRPRRRPHRQRATYHRQDGVMHMLAALDLATGKLFYRIHTRKRWIEFRCLGSSDEIASSMIKSPLWSSLTPVNDAPPAIAGHDRHRAIPALTSRKPTDIRRWIM